MKKKLLAMILITGMILIVITGCNTKSGKEGNVSKDSETKDTTSTEPVELTVWGWDAGFNGVALEAAEKLYDGVTINFVEMGKADALQKIHTTLASGVKEELPDIVLISDLNAQGYLMSYPGAFKAMDDILNYDDFASYKKAAVSYDGVGYGIPFDTGVAGLFYRTDYIEEAGYTDEDMQDLTWEEYHELGKKLKKKGYLLETHNPNDIAEFQIMLQSAKTWFTNDTGEANFVNNPALKESFDIFKKANQGEFTKVVSDWTEFTGAINGGEVACVIRGSWITGVIKAADDQSGLWKVAPVPKLSVDGATNISNQGGSSWFILEGGKNADVASDFMAKTFGGNTDLYNTLLESINLMGTYLPASNIPAYDKEDEFFANTKINQIFVNWIDEIPAVNTGAFSAEAQAALLAVVPDILDGKDLDTCLSQAEEQFNQNIQE